VPNPRVPSPAIEPIPPRESPSVEIARRLLDYLFSGEIRPGDRLPSERQLAGSLGVGRSAVRDALRPLLLLGVVEARQGDGTYLRQPESSLLPQAVEWGLLLGDHTTLDLVEARTYIEVAIAELAATRRSDADLDRMRRELERMAAPDVDPRVFSDADLAFHLAVAQASGNAALLGTLSSIRSLLRVWIDRVLSAAPGTGPSYEEHVPIYEAIRNGDADAAASSMRAHMRSAQERLAQTLDSAGGDRRTLGEDRGAR
jgi:GntR family transcriptional regulator, transcriptional repressor for pyruvate dehydrogenase complex